MEDITSVEEINDLFLLEKNDGGHPPVYTRIRH